MNIKQLRVKLSEKGISSQRYSLNEGIKDDSYVLQEIEHDKWVVFYSERGEDVNKLKFDSEGEACAYLEHVLLRDREPGVLKMNLPFNGKIEYSIDRCRIEWVHLGKRIIGRYKYPVKGLSFFDNSGIVILETMGENRPDNVTIYEPNGNFRIRIKNPDNMKAIAWGDLYYISGELTLFNCCKDKVNACVINKNGEIVRTYETIYQLPLSKVINDRPTQAGH
jgi:hypothetical protein